MGPDGGDGERLAYSPSAGCPKQWPPGLCAWTAGRLPRLSSLGYDAAMHLRLHISILLGLLLGACTPPQGSPVAAGPTTFTCTVQGLREKEVLLGDLPWDLQRLVMAARDGQSSSPATAQRPTDKIFDSLVEDSHAVPEQVTLARVYDADPAPLTPEACQRVADVVAALQINLDFMGAKMGRINRLLSSVPEMATSGSTRDIRDISDAINNGRYDQANHIANQLIHAGLEALRSQAPAAPDQ
jgi:hypothetical protein